MRLNRETGNSIVEHRVTLDGISPHLPLLHQKKKHQTQIKEMESITFPIGKEHISYWLIHFQ